MNIVFLGTPEIAKVCLAKILKTKHKVLAVVTNPDRPSGRGIKLLPSPVKVFAQQNNIPVLQYESVSKQGVNDLKKLNPDALVLVAFGQILSKEVLGVALPINMHGSLLPALRGPSPIQTAILRGLNETGVTVMKMEQGVDTGDMLLQKTLPISLADTSGSLFEKMADLGATAIVEALDIIESGKAVWTKQNHKNATYCEMLTKENAKLNFNDKTDNIVNKVRAYNPSPVGYFEYGGEKFKVFSAQKVTADLGNFNPGQVAMANSKNGLIVKTLDGFVEIVEMQAPNGKRMLAKQYLNGKKIEVGAFL